MSRKNSISPEGKKLMKAVVLAQVERENAERREMAIKNLQQNQKTVGKARSLTPLSSSYRTPTPSPSPPPSPVRKKKTKKKKKKKKKKTAKGRKPKRIRKTRKRRRKR